MYTYRHILELMIKMEIEFLNMNIKQLKKELQLSNNKIAVFFDLTPMAFANSTAKKRYEQALVRFYKYVKEHEPEEACG